MEDRIRERLSELRGEYEAGQQQIQLLEQRREELVDREGRNNNKQAEYNARSNELWLEPWRQTDPRVLLGLAFKLLGENAGRIGTLTITPDLLSSILEAKN